MLQSEKKCAECGIHLVGRIDKRFCSDQCRNTFNNRLNSDLTRYMRNTNNTLRRNRRILEELNTGGETRIRRDKLLAKGFDFDHVTSLHVTKEGLRYFYCYEQGYLPLKKGYFRLVVKKDLS